MTDFQKQYEELKKEHALLERKYKKLKDWRDANIKHTEAYRLYSQTDKIRYWSLDFNPEKMAIKAKEHHSFLEGLDRVIKELRIWYENVDENDFQQFIGDIKKSISEGFSPIDRTLRFSFGGKTRWIRTIAEFLKDDNGRAFRIIGANIDETESMIYKKRFDYHLRMEEAIAGIATEVLYINQHNKLEKLKENLRIIGETANLDYLYQAWSNQAIDRIVEVLEWKRKDSYSFAGELRIDKSLIEPMLKIFEKDNVAVFNNLNEIPDELKVLKEVYRKRGIKSALLSPLFFNGEPRGVTAFFMFSGKRMWQDVDIRAIKIIATIFSGVYSTIEKDRKISEREKIYRYIFDLSPSGIVLENENGIILDVNPAYCKALGYKREELVGKHISMVVFKPGKDHVSINIDKIVAEEKELRHIELTRRKDGSACHMLLHERAVDLPNNKKGILCITEDISEQVAAQEALRESEERYRILTENSPEAIGVHQKGKLVYVNKAAVKLLGASSKKELLGRNILDFVHPDYKKLVMERTKKVLEEGINVDTMEEKFIRLDGKEVFVETTALNISYNNQPASLVVVRDVTERKNTEEQNRKLQERVQHIKKMEAIGTLAGGIAHDFNNILTIINGHSELLHGKMDSDSPLQKYIKAIMEAGKRAQELTGQILAFSRKQHFAPRPVRPEKVIREMTSMLRRFAGKDIMLKIEFQENLPSINADPGQLEQILMNLVINAKDAIEMNEDESGKREITLYTYFMDTENLEEQADYTFLEPGKYVILRVSDTGQGMEPDILERIFEPFFTTKEVDKGTGLGLSTVYGIVQQNNAHIRVNSQPGEGTTFEIFWPAAPDSVDEEQQKTAEEGEIVSGSGTIIVVISDDDIKSYTVDALRELGYKVLEMNSFLEVKTFLSATEIHVDLFIFDLILYRESEKQLYQSINGQDVTVKMLLVSGYSREYLEENGMIGENVEYIKKPFSIGELSKKVWTVISDKNG